jgi:hypothetical protein
MNSSEILTILCHSSNYNEIYIPEFTYGNMRIDAIAIDLCHRWIRGFEIKISRSDFLKDKKFVLYTQVCSSISIVCPANLINPEEIEKPFGLLWIKPKDSFDYRQIEWKKRPQNFQKRNSLAWLWTYIHVIEKEFPRINEELIRIKQSYVSTQKLLHEAWEKYPDLLKVDIQKY